MRAPISTVIAILAGLFVLLGYFLPDIFGSVQQLLLQWAVALAAFAALAGLYNLFMVHWRKVQTNQPTSGYSAILIIAFVLTVIAVGMSGPTGGLSLWIFNNIQVPIETSLVALLAVMLAYASARLLQRRSSAFTIVFLSAALLALLGSAPFFLGGNNIPLLATVRNLMTDIFATAGARGILLGVSLGVVATGIRLLAGIDRPYGG